MQRVLSTHLFVNHRLTVALLNKIMNAGIPAVEIFCARQHIDYYNKAQIAELGHWFRDSTLKLHSIHLPMFNDEYWGRSGPQAVVNITEPVKGKRIRVVDELKRALELAETIPFQYAIQHLGVSGEEYHEQKIDSAFTALEELTVFARQRGVEVLLENIPNALSSAERLIHFNRMTHLGMNFVLDLGHANMNEGVEGAYEIMKDRLRSTHVHDNDGAGDTHLFPLLGDAGTIDWRRAMSLLRSRDGQLPLLLEIREVEGMENPLQHVNRVYDRLEALRDDE
ncbi:MAG: sugar phosphate isomerase/epimerase family protein [Bryobacteraceae bacterium]